MFISEQGLMANFSDGAMSVSYKNERHSVTQVNEEIVR